MQAAFGFRRFLSVSRHPQIINLPHLLPPHQTQPCRMEYPGGVDMQVVVPVYCLGEAGQYDGRPYIWYRGLSSSGGGGGMASAGSGALAVGGSGAVVLQPSGGSLQPSGSSSATEAGSVSQRLHDAVETAWSLLASAAVVAPRGGGAHLGTRGGGGGGGSSGPILVRVSKQTDAGPMVGAMLGAVEQC